MRFVIDTQSNCKKQTENVERIKIINKKMWFAIDTKLKCEN